MWSDPGGPLRSPGLSASSAPAEEINDELAFQSMNIFDEIISSSIPDNKPLDFRSPWISRNPCHISEPVSVSSVMPYQSSIPIPLERRLHRPPQTYQRTNHSCHLIRRPTTCTHPRIENNSSLEDARSMTITGQWNSFEERSTSPILGNAQNCLSPPGSSESFDSQLRLESSNDSNLSSEMLDCPVPISDLPVYVVSDQPSTVSNLTVPTLPISPPGFKYHLSVDANSLTVKLRFEVQDQSYDDYVSSPSVRKKKMSTDGNKAKEAVFMMYDMRALSTPMVSRYSAQALQVASQVIRHARFFKMPDERELWCPDCGLLPSLPVTGQCGHTRCSRCILENRACPCGMPGPKSLHINTLIQDLIKKMLPNNNYHRDTELQCSDVTVNELKSSPRSSQARPRRVVGLSSHRAHSRRSPISLSSSDLSPSAPMSPEARVARARRLAAAGQLREAAVHLARAALAAAPLARLARLLLAQTISAAAVKEGCDARRVARWLMRGVRSQSARAWLSPADLECVLCYHAYSRPVTTPCGHTYCRTCLERSMDYRKFCALCQRPLADFDLAATRETVFINAALASIDALRPPLPPEPDVIPIFVCTVAYPAIPCPLFIFDPRYWMMIRRVLESGSRKFGMVAYERDRSYSDYGTVLEVRDCVHLEDGRSILSTVGVSRFRVMERDVRDGCDVARIQPLTDIIPTEKLVIWDLRLMATQIWYKATAWLDNMGCGVRSEIEAAFGRLPALDPTHSAWWTSADGPAWLWWLIAILPLRSEIKILILSTRSLLKRVMAVSRTLEAIDQVTMSATASSECELLDNAEEWLETSA